MPLNNTPISVGKVTLVRATAPALWWYVRTTHPNEPIEILIRPKPSDLYSLYSSQSPFDELRVYAIFPGNDISYLPKDITHVDSSLIIYVWVSDFDGSLPKKAEKAYNSLTGDIYQALDLRSQNYLTDPLISTTLLRLPITLRDSLIKDFVSNPSRLLWQAQQLNPLLYTVPKDIESEALALLEDLGTQRGLITWGSMTRKLMYSLFLTPEQERCGMYLILAGGGKNQGRCPVLWFYFHLFFQALSQKFYSQPNQLLKLFATWVYLTNTIWATKYKPGLHKIQTKKQKPMLIFNPSPAAIEEFFRLIRTPILD